MSNKPLLRRYLASKQEKAALTASKKNIGSNASGEKYNFTLYNNKSVLKSNEVTVTTSGNAIRSCSYNSSTGKVSGYCYTNYDENAYLEGLITVTYKDSSLTIPVTVYNDYVYDYDDSGWEDRDYTYTLQSSNSTPSISAGISFGADVVDGKSYYFLLDARCSIDFDVQQHVTSYIARQVYVSGRKGDLVTIQGTKFISDYGKFICSGWPSVTVSGAEIKYFYGNNSGHGNTFNYHSTKRPKKSEITLYGECNSNEYFNITFNATLYSGGSIYLDDTLYYVDIYYNVDLKSEYKNIHTGVSFPKTETFSQQQLSKTKEDHPMGGLYKYYLNWSRKETKL